MFFVVHGALSSPARPAISSLSRGRERAAGGGGLQRKREREVAVCMCFSILWLIWYQLPFDGNARPEALCMFVL